MSDDRLSIFSAALEVPARDALIWRGAALSFLALATRVAHAMRALRALGVSAGDRVVVRAENHPDAVVALLALMELDAAAVLLHPRLTAREAEALVADAAPKLTLDALPESRDEPIAFEARAHDPDVTLAMLYTSGTTGRPKGAMLPRRAFIASAAASAENLGWAPDDRWLLCLPVCHVGGLSVLTRCLIARRPVVLLPRFDARAVLDSIATERATLLSVVPTMLASLLDADDTAALSRPRAMLVGGAATPRALLERCAERGVRALTTWGLTEACSQVTTQRYVPTAPFSVREDSGAALGGAELAIVDEDGAPVEAGAIGRILVRGPTMMTGYWGHAPRRDGEWFDTGDLGSFDAERMLYISARRTDLIVTGGENVYPVEVEHSLCEIDGISAAMVFGAPDDRWGQVVAAAIVRSRTIDDEERWLAETATLIAGRLAPHKRPRRVCVVDALPMRSTGKVDRAEGVRRFTPMVRVWG